MAGNRWDMYLIVLASLTLAACATTSVQPVYERAGTALPRPEVVLVYPFAVSADQVTPNQGFFAQTAAALGSTPMDDQKRQVAAEAANRFANDLVTGINGLGLPARLATGATSPSAKAVLVTGAFIDIDEGNRLQRLAIGLGAGQSRVDARMRLTSWSGGREIVLARFEAHADSGEMPGAAVTMGAGAAAQGGVTAGMAAGNVALGGVKAYRSSIDPMLDRTAQKALVTLSHFFAGQDWIPADKVTTLTWSDL